MGYLHLGASKCGLEVLKTGECYSVVPAFKSAAEDLLNNSGLSAVELLAKALATAAVSPSLCQNQLTF